MVKTEDNRVVKGLKQRVMGPSFKKVLGIKEKPVVLAKGFYEVKKVLQKRIVNRKTEWFVRWKGYADFHNEWIFDLPDAFHSEWGPASDKGFEPTPRFTALVELANSIKSGDVNMNPM
jgi:hypothetical protein